MAIACPAASILAGAFFYFLYIGLKGILALTIAGVLYYLSWVNLALAAFSLVLAFPLLPDWTACQVCGGLLLSADDDSHRPGRRARPVVHE